MTFKEACQALGLSRSTFQRKIKSGAIKATKVGEGQFAKLEFDPIDLGLPATEPKTTPLEGDLRADLSGTDTTAPPAVTELGPLPVGELDDVSSAPDETLQEWVALGCRPDNPHGPISNVPCAGTTMPSPENFKRAAEARAELEKRQYARMPRVRAPRVYYGQRSSVTADCAQHNSMVSNLGRIL
jgi:excisionase family DNA binding protein